MKIIGFKIDLAVRDAANESAIKNLVESSINGIDAILACEIKGNSTGARSGASPAHRVVIPRQDVVGAKAEVNADKTDKTKRKYTKRAVKWTTKSQTDAAAKANGEKTSVHINHDGDTVTTRK